MAQYATKAQLRTLAREIPLVEQQRLRKSTASFTESSASTTFLSHSSKDEDLVVGVSSILTKHGTIVYIDSVDPAMPPYTTAKTAETLKTRIAQTSKFILLATSNSKDSKWVPWELGVADGKKGLTNIALFPSIEDANDKSWTSWEYLGLYRRIMYGKHESYPQEIWMVLDEKTNTGTELSKWLKS